MVELTSDLLRLMLRYSRRSGRFTWLRRDDCPSNRNTKFVGKIAGTISKSTGYRIISIRFGGKSRKYRASRLAWLYVTGDWPSHHVDHRNLNRSDDRFANLRDATRSQNGANGRARSHNRLGVKGVSERRGKFRVHIKRSGLKLFDTLEQAKTAYRKAARRCYGEFARTA